MTRPLQLLLALATCACAADLPLAIFDISPDSGRSPSDGITASPTLTIHGQGRVGDEIAIAIDSKAAGTVRVTESGDWTFDLTRTPLVPGQHVLSASSGLGAGQHASSYTILVDTKAPAAPTFTVAEPDTGSSATDWVTSAHDLVLRGKGEAGSQVSLSIASIAIGTVTVATNGDWSLPITGFADGTYSLSAQAIDAAGNASPAALKTLRVDSTPPAAPSIASMSTDTGPSATDRITRDVTPTVGGLTEAGATVAVFVDGIAAGTTKAGSTGAWSFTTTALSDGEHTVTTQATDLAGLNSPASQAFSLTIKTWAIAPTISITPDTGDSGDGITSAKTLVLSGSAGDGISMAISIDGRPAGTPPVVDGAWTLDRSAYPLEDGTHALVATATDIAGNQTAAVLNLRIDSAPPAAPTALAIAGGSQIFAGQPVTVSGQAAAGSRIEVLIDGSAQPGLVQADATGEWQLNQVVFTLGDHSLSAVAIDIAGNRSAPSAPLAVQAKALSSGELVTIHFRATVASVDDLDGTLGGGIQVGQELNGSYTYRMGAVDSNPLETVGDYRFYEGGTGISVRAGEFSFASAPNPDFLMEMVNDHYQRDNYLLRSYRNNGERQQVAAEPIPLSVGHIAWQLDDPSARALSSTELSAQPPFLGHWQSDYGLTIEGGRSTDPLQRTNPWFIRAHVLQVWSDDQPAPPLPAPAPGNG